MCASVSSNWGPLTVSLKQYPWNPPRHDDDDNNHDNNNDNNSICGMGMYGYECHSSGILGHLRQPQAFSKPGVSNITCLLLHCSTLVILESP